jgi:hypothetical protein
MRHKRVVVTRYGGPEVIAIIEEEIPNPKAGEVRVKVLAAGVGLPDLLAREGVHPETPRVPIRMYRSATTPCASHPSRAACNDSAYHAFHICIGFDICLDRRAETRPRAFPPWGFFWPFTRGQI